MLDHCELFFINERNMPKTSALSFLRILLGFLLIIIQSLIFIPIFILFLPSRYILIRIGNFYGRTVSPIILWILGSRFEFEHRERINASYPAIYLSNHSSQLDPLIAIWLGYYGVCGVSKKEIVSIPFFGWAYWLSGHLLIDRSNKESAIASISELQKDVKRLNLGVWIWPEGTRSIDGRLMKFKKGFAHIAIGTRLPIVPIVVKHGHKRWPSKTLFLDPGVVEVEVLEAIDTSSWSLENLDEHIKHVEDLYNEHLPEEQKRLEQ